MGTTNRTSWIRMSSPLTLIPDLIFLLVIVNYSKNLPFEFICFIISASSRARFAPETLANYSILKKVNVPLLATKRLTGHAVLVPVKRANAAGFQIELGFFARGHFPTKTLATTGEFPPSLDRWGRRRSHHRLAGAPPPVPGRAAITFRERPEPALGAFGLLFQLVERLIPSILAVNPGRPLLDQFRVDGVWGSMEQKTGVSTGKCLP